MKKIAVLCSDLHLSHRPPSCRSAEKNWYAAMNRQLQQLKAASEDSGGVPIIAAGDIFDHWNPPIELVNFAIEKLPHLYAIPGQHDLPNHSHKYIKRSAYWNLIKAGKVTNLKYKKPVGTRGGKIILHGFPWKKKLIPLKQIKQKFDCKIHLAVVHSYIWKKNYGHEKAKQSDHLSSRSKQLKGYDAIVVGDNHKGFLAETKAGQPLLNCGTFFRRTTAEVEYAPQIGFLWENGTISVEPLDASQDLFSLGTEGIKGLDDKDTKEFVRILQTIGGDSIDFRELVIKSITESHANNTVRNVILEALDASRE